MRESFLITILCFFSLSFIACQNEQIESYSVPKGAVAQALQPAAEPGEADQSDASKIAQAAHGQSAGQSSSSGSAASMPPGMGMGGMPGMSPGMGMPGMPPGHGVAPKPRNDVSWTVPAGWDNKPGSSIRVGSFSIGGKAEVSVIPLPGEAGGLLANINLWRSQLQLPEVTKPEESSRKIKVAEIDATLVDLTSTEKIIEDKEKGSIIAAVVPREGEMWFFKMMGDAETVKANREAFTQFLASVKFNAK